MDKIRLIFFFTLLAIVIVIARYNSPSKKAAAQPVAAAAASISPEVAAATTPVPIPASTAVAAEPAKAQPSATPSAVFQKIAPKVSPAVAMISVFDESGKLLRTGSGCFISRDGRLVTSASIVQGAAHGVAKVSDGRIINVSGILAESSASDLAVLNVETKKGVNYLSPDKSASPNAGVHIAVVGSSLRRQQPGYLEGTTTGRGSDPAGEWLETGLSIPKDLVGAPVVNDKGELVGIVTSQKPQGATTDVARRADALEKLIAGIDSNAAPTWQVADKSPNDALPPADGPTATPTPSRFAKIPVVQADRPDHTRLISSPKPAYPTAARHSYFPLKGNGRYRVSFDASGQVTNVTVLESTRSETLDGAAIDALRRWKAAPGQQWSATVPVTFQP